MKAHKKREAIMPLDIPADVLYARLLARALTRSKCVIGDQVYNAWIGAIRSRNWTRLTTLAEDLDTVEHVGVLGMYVKSQLVALVKKYPFTREEVPGIDPELVAWKKFQLTEHRCKRVNQRQSVLRNGVGFSHGDLLTDAKRWIRSTLGSLPDMEEIYGLCDFGPGASVGVSGNLTNVGRKLLTRSYSVTRLALPLCTRAMWKHSQIRDFLLREKGQRFVSYDFDKFSQIVAARARLVRHNKISFVPKTFKTKRSIASEPLLNGYLQKGIDQYMRRRLAAAGIDLRRQEPNQLLARDGSVDESRDPYCTIDLSSASDSLSTSVVRMLLPPAWFDLLDRARAHEYRYRGRDYPYTKFVSMGNGFCFPLQTAIFSSICSSACKALGRPVDFRVYGDDIIVRRSVAALVLEVLRYLGFRSNPDKTFIFGSFRESCGTDWYCGVDIRPLYLDYRLETNLDLYKIHNSSLATDLTYGFFTEVREMIREACPSDVRFVRPYHGNADSAFTVEKDVAMSSHHMVWKRDRWAWSWTEIETSAYRDTLFGQDPDLCNAVEYLAVLRGSPSSVPLAVRRKTKARLRRKSYWALPAEISWKGADPDRAERPY